MDIKVRLNSQFEAVYLVNGIFVEGGEVCYGGEDVIYITVLPLNAMLLPYTVKLVGGKVAENKELSSCYKLPDGRFYLKFLPRYNYIYSTLSKQKSEQGIAEKFFFNILDNKPESARACLTTELSSGIDNFALNKFFEGYIDIIAEDACKGRYYLVNSKGEGVLYNFILKNNLIDNIVENDL